MENLKEKINQIPTGFFPVIHEYVFMELKEKKFLEKIVRRNGDIEILPFEGLRRRGMVIREFSKEKHYYKCSYYVNMSAAAQIRYMIESDKPHLHLTGADIMSKKAGAPKSKTGFCGQFSADNRTETEDEFLFTGSTLGYDSNGSAVLRVAKDSLKSKYEVIEPHYNFGF